MADLIPEVRIIVQLKDRTRELEAALREAASTLQDLAGSCRHYGHDRAVTAAEACEQHIRAALAGSTADRGVDHETR